MTIFILAFLLLTMATAAAAVPETLIVGVMGGFRSANAPSPGVARLAAHLTARHLPGVTVQTIENRHTSRILAQIRAAKPRTLVLYGHSLGGPAAVRLAQRAGDFGIPVALLVEVDGVGGHNLMIPPNVVAAANFYQHEGWLHGGATILPEDPMRTKILGNYEYHYRGRVIDESGENLARRVFFGTHLKMENDPQLWTDIERVILEHLP